jgi:hypothetical protein
MNCFSAPNEKFIYWPWRNEYARNLKDVGKYKSQIFIDGKELLVLSLNTMILSALFYKNLNADFCPNSVDESMTQAVSVYVEDNRVWNYQEQFYS